MSTHDLYGLLIMIGLDVFLAGGFIYIVLIHPFVQERQKPGNNPKRKGN
jgi:hypothetical protein